MKTDIYLWYLRQFLDEEIFQTEVIEKIKTHILCSISFFPPKVWRLWDNVEKYGRTRQATDDNIVWGTRIACWILKATHANSEYVIFIAFALKQWLQEHTSLWSLYVTLPVLF